MPTPNNIPPIEASAFQEWRLPNGELWAEFFKVECGYVIRFSGLADFFVSADGLEIQSYPGTGISAQTVNHLRLNQVEPLALSRQLALVIHGSAVEISQGAIAFLGSSGRGKSTLAASFATDNCRFLTDDGLQLDFKNNRHFVKPSHPSIRLWSDSEKAIVPDAAHKTEAIAYSSKSRFLAGEAVAHCSEPKELIAVYFLGEGNTKRTTITPIKAVDAMIELIRHSFLLDVEERAMLSQHFKGLSALVKRPIFFHLDYPRDYSLLQQLKQALIAHSSSVSKGSLPYTALPLTTV